MKRLLAISVIAAILIGALALGIELLGDDWTQPGSSEQENAEMETARQICAGFAFLLIVVSVPVMRWSYRAGTGKRWG